MPGFRKASSCNETYIPTTDDGKTQEELSLKYVSEGAITPRD
jgi:hypothetical protein